MKKIDTLIEILYNIYMLLKGSPNFKHLQHDELMTRQQVKDYLCISESTYKRKVKDGTLQPIKMPGGDRFTKATLQLAFVQSKQRGRI